MSTTVDERVVSMQFDNRHFERNVQTTMSTLDKFKQKLNLTGVAKGFDDVDKAAKKINLNGLSSAAEAVTVRFSHMQMAIQHQLNRIVDSALVAGKRIISALTVDPIKTGLAEYETQINSVQTILANTQSKGTTLQDVNRALDELNVYADKTIYNFTEMTRNIGTFTAAGIDLKTSVTAIQGIANLAAISGSTSQQASVAMYQLSQALSSGTVKLMDWNSVVNAGMGGQVFQDALKATARAHGIAVDNIIKKHGSFRESLQAGWITSEILTETLSKMTRTGVAEYLAELTGVEYDQIVAAQKEAEATGNSTAAYEKLAEQMAATRKITKEEALSLLKTADTAEDAATKVKTFSQLFDTLKEAAQSGWTQTWEIIIGDFGEAKELLTEISNVLGGMIGQAAEYRNTLLSEGLSSGWKQLLGAGIADEQGYIDSIKEIARQGGDAFDELVKSVEENGGDFYDALKQGLDDGTISSETMSKAVSNLCDKMSGMSSEELLAAGYTKEMVQQIQELDEQLKNGSLSMDDFTKKIMRPSGRENLIEALWNSFNGLMSVIKPVKEAFREIFPPMTGEQLYIITERIRDLTAKFTLSEQQSAKLKSTFKGLFAAIDIGVTFIKELVGGVIKLLGNFKGLGSSILDTTSSWGDWLTNLRDSVKETDLFGIAIDNVVGFLQKAIDKTKEFLRFVKEKFAIPGWEGFLAIMSSIWNVIQKIGSKISSIASSIGSALADAFRSGDIASGLDVINGGLLASILIGMKNFMNSIKEAAEESEGFFDKIKGILDGVKGSLEAWQQNLQADTLLKLAGAIGILAVSLLLLATIKPEKLTSSLSAITVLFGELVGSLAIFNKLDGAFKGAGKAVVTMIGMSTAILILAGALKVISSLSWSELGVALTGLTVTLGLLVGAVKILEMGNNVASGAGQMILMAGALTILAGTLKIIATMSWSELGIALTGLTVTLGVLVGAVKLLEMGKNVASGAGQMILMAGALAALAGVLKIIATMSWAELAVALTGLTVTLGVLVGAVAILNLLKKSAAGSAVAIAIISGAMLTLAGVLKIIATMSWTELGTALAGLAGTLAVLVITLAILDKMKYSMIGSSGAILIMAAAIAILTPCLKALGNMSIGEIIKSLVTLAATFAIIGVAGYLLAPITPAILAFSGAVALLGLSFLGIGAGVSLFAAGLGMLSTVTAASATAIVAALTIIVTGIAGLIPAVIQKIGEGIIVFCEVIAGSAESIGKAIKAVLLTLIDVIITCAPAIADGLFSLIIAAFNIFAERMPELIQAVVNVIMAFFSGVIDALGSIDTSTLIEGIVGVGLIAALIVALGAIAGLIPGAMVGVLGMGAVIVELAVVLAAIGALAQIPGLEWLISEGGNFMQTIGTALGQFIGGIAGGIAQGATAALPAIGTDLSMFMMNAMPFITGAKLIDSAVADGVKSLAEVILMLTAANILDGLTSWFTGGASIVDFGKQLADFGPHFRAYYESIKDVDADVIQASANAANALAEMASNLPNSGGVVSWFTGDNDLSSICDSLVPFAKSMKQYATEVAGIDPAVVTNSANAAKALAEMASNLPNSGGVVSWFTGDNDLASIADGLIPFGTAMKKYAAEVSGIDPAVVTNSANAAKALAEMASNLPNSGGVVSWFTGDNDIAAFGTSLVSFGENFAKYSDHMSGVDSGVLTATTNAASSIVQLQKSLPKEGGWFSDDMTLSDFGSDMSSLGAKLSAYYVSISGIDAVKMSSVITQTNRLVSMLQGMAGITSGSASTFVTEMNTLAQNGVDGFVTAFTNGHTKAQSAVSGLISAAVSGINTQSAQFQTAGSTIITNLITGISTNSTSVVTAINTIITTAITGIKGKYHEFVSAGAALMTKLISGAKTNSSGVTQAFKNIASSGVGAVNGYYTNFYNAGKYMVDGFAAGMKANEYKATNAGKEIAKKAYDAAMEELDAHSPSRVFMEVGSYVAQGFALGIQGDSRKSTEAASDMAAAAIDNVKNSISRIAETIDSGIDTNPTIRPVLDLTNVEAGTRRLHTMFSRDQALSVSASMSRDSSVDVTTGATTAKTGNTYQFTQINNSPKALSRTEIYRQTNNQFSAFERMVEA